MPTVRSRAWSRRGGYKVRVGRSELSGRGLFATDEIRRGEKICEYSGRVVHEDKAPHNRYLLHVTGKFVIDGSPLTNLGRWANHSCKPNAKYYTYAARAYLQALRRIDEGEEVTCDYGKEYRDAFLKECLCPVCKRKLQKRRMTNGK